MSKKQASKLNNTAQSNLAFVRAGLTHPLFITTASLLLIGGIVALSFAASPGFIAFALF